MRSAARTVAWGLGVLLAVPVSGLLPPAAPGAVVPPGQRAWGTVATISSGPSDALRPRVASGYGGAATVWEQDGAVWVARQPRGGAWEAPVRLGKGRAPVVEMYGQGGVAVAWRGPRASILLSSAGPVQDWKSPVTLSPQIKRSDRPRGAGDPQLAIGDNGTMAVVFAFNTATKPGAHRFKVRAAVRPPGGSWHTMDVTDGSPSSTEPVVGVDMAGGTYVVYRSKGAIFVRQKPAGKKWHMAERLSDVGASPTLSVPRSGRAVAAWVEPQAGGAVPVYAARRLKSGWQDADLISPPDVVAGEPQVGCDGHDGAAVAWTVAPGGVQEADMYPHGGWHDPVLLTTSSDGGTAGPRIDVGANGPRFVTWWRYTDSGSSIEAAWRSGGFWTVAQQLTPSGGEAQTPDVAVNSWDENALVVWAQPDTSDPDGWYRVVGSWWTP